jgi:WhiB family redox-sensing transcriptional regulator
MTTMLNPPAPSPQLTPCRSDPDPWTDGDDPVLKTLCRRRCARRAQCARDALATRGASGVWAGIYLPPTTSDSRRHDYSRAHEYAVTRLRVIAGLDGQP